QSRAGELPDEVRASLARTLGTALLHLGEPAKAQPRLQEALALSTRLHGASAPATLAVAIDAALATGAAEPAAAETALGDAITQAEAIGAHELRARAGIALSSHLESQGRIDDAFAVSSRTVELARQELAADAPAMLAALHNQA